MKTSSLYLLILSTFFASNIYASIYKKSPDQIISSLKCKKQIKKLIYQGWGSKDQWIKKPTGEKNGVQLSSPTRTFSKWIQIEASSNKIKTSLVTPQNALVIYWDHNCKKKTKIITRKHKQNNNQFTDYDLKELITKNKNGVIYLWGPNMPWSLKGIPEILSAGKKMNLPITILRSPKSNNKLASKQLEKFNLNHDYAKTHNSLEIFLRGGEIHLPAILTYKDGRLERFVKPGHETSEMFQHYLSKEFSK